MSVGVMHENEIMCSGESCKVRGRLIFFDKARFGGNRVYCRVTLLSMLLSSSWLGLLLSMS